VSLTGLDRQGDTARKRGNPGTLCATLVHAATRHAERERGRRRFARSPQQMAHAREKENACASRDARSTRCEPQAVMLAAEMLAHVRRLPNAKRTQPGTNVQHGTP
jgi:hypothetical protein